jgi:hypothetical protein
MVATSGSAFDLSRCFNASSRCSPRIGTYLKLFRTSRASSAVSSMSLIRPRRGVGATRRSLRMCTPLSDANCRIINLIGVQRQAGWPVHHVQHMLDHASLQQTSTYLNTTLRAPRVDAKPGAIPRGLQACCKQAHPQPTACSQAGSRPRRELLCSLTD